MQKGGLGGVDVDVVSLQVQVGKDDRHTVI